MTLNEIAVLIAERAKRQLDEPFREMIKDRVRVWRSTLIRDALNKDPGRRKFFLQSLTVPMERKPAQECGIPMNCYIAQSTYQIPYPITANKLLYEYVGMVDGMSAFSWVERSWLKYKSHDKYSSSLGTYTALNRKIQVHHQEDLTHILIEGVFDDPEEVEKLRCDAAGTACNYGDSQFPAPNDIIQKIIQYVMRVDLGIIPDADKPETEIPVTQDNG